MPNNEQLMNREDLGLQEEAEREAEYGNQLDMLRQEETASIQQAADQLLQEGLALAGPSGMKWGIVFSLGLLNDVVDLLALTGFLEILAWLVSMGLTVTILLIIWFTDQGLKRAQEYTENIADQTQQIQLSSQARQIEGEVRELAESAASRLKSIPGLSRVGVRNIPRKNPLARAFLGSAFESVPYLGAVNLITVWLFFSYLAERSAIKNAKVAAEEAYASLSGQAKDMV